MQNTQKLLSVKDLTKHFPISAGLFTRKKGVVHANDGVSFDIYKGETFSLVGESGSGKSTLGRSVLRLHEPTKGSIFYYGKGCQGFSPRYLNTVPTAESGVDLTRLTAKEMRGLRKYLQVIFQDPYSSLDPRMSVGRIVAEGVTTHGLQKKNSPQMWEYVTGVLRSCGLSEETLRRFPHQFSGGQRQRVCIARALAVKPEFVVCDECVSALDVSVRSQILNLLQRLKAEEGLTYLFISHDLSVVRHVSDRVAVMYLGQLVELGRTAQIFAEPLHPYTISLLSAVPTLGKRQEKLLLYGQAPSPAAPPQGCRFHTRCFMAREICRHTPPPYAEQENGSLVRCHFAKIPTREKRRMAFSDAEKGK